MKIYKSVQDYSHKIDDIIWKMLNDKHVSKESIEGYFGNMGMQDYFHLVKISFEDEKDSQDNKCTYCDKTIPPGEKTYLDESEVDGAFCDEDCAKSFIRDTIKVVDKENRNTTNDIIRTLCMIVFLTTFVVLSIVFMLFFSDYIINIVRTI